MTVIASRRSYATSQVSCLFSSQWFEKHIQQSWPSPKMYIHPTSESLRWSDPTSQDATACVKKTLNINYEISNAVENSCWRSADFEARMTKGIRTSSYRSEFEFTIAECRNALIRKWDFFKIWSIVIIAHKSHPFSVPWHYGSSLSLFSTRTLLFGRMSANQTRSSDYCWLEYACQSFEITVV